jgi:ferric-dicitrate binding protein FerR (iron transport regulator)
MSDTLLTIAHHQDVSAELGFVTGQLVLNNLPLKDAIADLDRWYDVDIRLADASLGDRLISAVLKRGSVADVSDVLHLIFSVRAVRDGRTLTLYPH